MVGGGVGLVTLLDKGGQDGATDPHRVLVLRVTMILIFIMQGARAVISFCMRSAIPGYMVVPPDMTLLAYRSFLMSMSHFMMLL